MPSDDEVLDQKVIFMWCGRLWSVLWCVSHDECLMV